MNGFVPGKSYNLGEFVLELMKPSRLARANTDPSHPP
jgi:hypothetical protein